MERLIIVTGRSGAGRTTTLSVFEDLGFEAINNIPLGLVSKLIELPSSAEGVVLGIDVRSRDFSVSKFLEIIQECRASDRFETELVFLDAQDDILIRRFSETRRRHPLTPDLEPRTGVEQEARVLSVLKERADTVINTTDLSPHQLKAEIKALFQEDRVRHLSVSIQSFSYKKGLPRSADMVWDCRFLRNPHWDRTLRAQTGLSPMVGAYIAEDPSFAPFVTHVVTVSEFLLPLYLKEGKSHFGVAFGCSGGKHRSVYLTETLSKHLEKQGWRVSVRHRELTDIDTNA